MSRNNQIANRDKVRTIAAAIKEQKKNYVQVLPKHMDVERFSRVVIAAVAKTPQLLQCTPESVLTAVAQAASLGLEPTGVLGSAYLVPYRTKVGDAYKTVCQLIIGYRGLIDLARRSGQIESIEAHVVREGDTFEVEYGLNPKLVHKPNWENTDGELRFVYAVARLKGGAVQYEVMSKAQIDKVRDSSKAGKSGPWVDHYEEMARKTVVRRLAKYLPLSVEFHDAIAAEEGGPVVDVSASIDEIAEQAAIEVEAVSRTDEVKRRLAAGDSKEEESEAELGNGAAGDAEVAG